MRANISEELLDAINERIYLDLEIHVLTSKMNKSDNEKFKNYIYKIISSIITERKKANDYLKQNGVKIYEPEEIDDMFVKYQYSQKVNGGYKEGYQQFWKSAIKYKLKQRMSRHFGGDSSTK